MEDRLVHWIDLLRLPLAALGQQKLRTCLTTLGVVFGAFVLAASLSIDEGVQQTIERESNKGDVSRKVTVSPGWRASREQEGERREGRRADVAGTPRANPQGPRPARPGRRFRRAGQPDPGSAGNALANPSRPADGPDRQQARSSRPWATGPRRRASRPAPARTPSSASGSSSAGRSTRTTSDRSCSPRCSRTGSA